MSERRWQYKVLTIKISTFSSQAKRDDQLTEALNRQALDGWELVTVNHPYGGYPTLYLRK